MKDPIITILEYNASRQYFGCWSPAQLSAIYHQAEKSENFTLLELKTGQISIDDICDTLWNEMSYNPIRFGQKSPFVFDGINSIQKFCNCAFKENPSTPVLSKLKSKLRYFTEKIKEIEPSFSDKRSTTAEYVSIGTENEYSKTPNKSYEILKILRECIKEICLQNVSDYKYWAQKDPTTAANISSLVIQRHPNFIRPIKIPNYSLEQRISQIGTAIEKISKEQESLRSAVLNKTEETYATQIKIESLQDYEEPVDTSSEEEILRRQNHELDLLQSRLDEKNKTLRILLNLKTKQNQRK